MKYGCCFFLLLIVIKTHAQTNCSVSLSGDTCIQSFLTADTKGGSVDSLIWYSDNEPVEFFYKLSYGNPQIYAGKTTGIDAPQRMCIDRQNNIYTTSTRTCDVKKWIPGADTPIVVAGRNGCGNGPLSLNSPAGIFVDSAGNLYVAEALGGKVSKWVPDAPAKTVVASNGLSGPYDICFDKKGNMYIPDYNNNNVTKWAPGAVRGEIVAGGNGNGSGLNQFSGPNAVAVDDSGYLYVSDYFNSRIMRWAPGAKEGVIVAGGNGPGYSVYETQPYDIALDKKGNLFIADGYNRVLLWPKKSQHSVTIAAGYDSLVHSKFGNTASIDFDSLGNLYVLSSHSYNILHEPDYVYRLQNTNIINKNYALPSPFYGSVGNYKVKSFYKNGCSALSDSVYLNAAPYYGEIDGQRGGLCGSSIQDYSIDIARANYYIWHAPPGTKILSGQGTKSIVLSVADNFQKDTLYVRSQNGCGEAISYLALTNYPSNPSYISGLSYVYPQEDSLPYKVVPDEVGVTYTWTVPADVTIMKGQGTSKIVVKWGNNEGYIYVVSSNNCGNALKQGKKFIRLQSALFSGRDNNKKNIITAASLKITPNPTTGNTTLTLSNKNEKVKIKIVDVSGKVIWQTATGESSIIIPSQQFADRMYNVQVINEKGVENLRFIKQ